ncbi:MAG: DUF7164 domain-containing protein [Cellulosilyticaceae bacterium]
MKRAVVIFIENKPHLITEMKVLSHSLDLLMCLDTDLVVFGPKQALLRVPPNCIKLDAHIVSNRPKWKNYHYINSLACLCEESAKMLDQYDFILRSDADTFLTPAWNTFYPEGYMTGKGGYVNDDFTKEKLTQIASKLGLRHKGIFNIGSTHYGDTRLVREVCQLSVEVAAYILQTEFLSNEGQWPGWFRGVTSMYATEIAVNHLVDDLVIAPDKLDFRSDSHEPVANHPHIHCWHTNDIFSKFAFEKGTYNNINLQTLNPNIVCDYCLATALKSHVR